MRPAIVELTKAAEHGGEAMDRFLSEHSVPIVEGDTVTFVYQGEADAVNLRQWIYGLPSQIPFSRMEDTDLWYLLLDLPEKSRVEYKLEIVDGNDSRWILDPLNPNYAHDPYGANSVCQSEGYEEPGWALPDQETRAGTLESLELESAALDKTMTVRLYLPARFRRRARYPLLIVHDGDDYLKYSRLQTVLDNLVHRLEIPQMIVALTNPVERLHEYADCEDHSTFLVNELLPHLEERLPLAPSPSSRGLMGASFGAVAALACTWRHPGVFGRLLLQSGSFGFTDIGDQSRGPAFDPVVEFVNAFRANPGHPTDRTFMSCGVYESLIYENRSLLPVLQGTGMQVRFVEARDGHNWENWRDRLREGLSYLFPGPLWMVYE